MCVRGTTLPTTNINPGYNQYLGTWKVEAERSEVQGYPRLELSKNMRPLKKLKCSIQG